MLEIPFSTNVILIAAIIAQGIFASVLLLLQRNNSNSNKYLGLLLLTFSLWLLDDFFEAATIYQQDPNYYFLPIYFSFGFGPLIYFYTRSITDVNFKLRKRHLVHFIPVAIQGIGYVFLQCKDYNFRRTFWQEVHLPYTYNLEFIGSLVSLIIYLCLSIIVVKKYQKWINNQFSEISKINLNWLKIILGIISVISFLWIVDTFLRLVQEYYPMHEFSAISMGISILLLAGGSLLQSNLGHAGFEESNSNKISLDKEIEIDKQLLE
ncbi:MAG: hypothetical protein HKO66_16775, partial [Saprospiraceae bacterium]|nr:hypothetical protein [Bacteroidia bacterium]NNL93900.1 hypothetical protein [Saprospiraceae bacterium]